MKIRSRRRRNYTGIVLGILVIIVVIGVFFVYMVDRRLKNSPEYIAGRVTYVFKRDNDYAFVLVDSSKSEIKLVYMKDKLYLYDPQTKAYLSGTGKDTDLNFFSKVFGLNTDDEYYINLDGGNIIEFSSTLIGKKTEDLKELINALRTRKQNIFDSFRADSMARSFRLFSNLTSPAILKLINSMASYIVSELDEIPTVTDYPVKIIVGKDKKKELYRLYLSKEGKEKLIEFLSN
ncbi:MAG: hypothetical protein J7L34_00185 [Thermotogaceae bacterium]|nr:hypothetical protein [Thermotogaceae bacterium]